MLRRTGGNRAEMRDDKGRFLPGNNANPGGRPKADPEVVEKLHRLTPKAVDVLELYLDMAISGESFKEGIKAAETILAYTTPKPKQEQSIELTGANGGYIGIDAPRSETREEWKARRAKLANTNGVNGAHPITTRSE